MPKFLKLTLKKQSLTQWPKPGPKICFIELEARSPAPRIGDECYSLADVQARIVDFKSDLDEIEANAKQFYAP